MTDGRLERTKLCYRAQELISEIAQMFRDTAQWNEAHPNEEPIDPDPDGELQRIYRGLGEMLAK